MNVDLFNYKRRESLTVNIGPLSLGGNNPIRVQSMANVDTNDTIACVAQTERIIAAGGELVRFTAQGIREANNLQAIHKQIHAHYTTPLVADIHFQPAVADVAAQFVEKVRINPGNYVDKARKFEQLTYTDDEYASELQRIRNRFVPFLNICKQHNTAIRIGVNHGSLSDRIMSRYGDTPKGMVESCMEFLRICVQENFLNVVISIKASNTVVMVQTVRLLVETMAKEQMTFPLHLGVTEAGDGEDGRIKSAVGIGALLADGLGDTIRVSLSEEPEKEIPVAKELVNFYRRRENHSPIAGNTYTPALQANFKRKTTPICGIGGGQQPVIFGLPADYTTLQPDVIYTDKGWQMPDGTTIPVVELHCKDLTSECISVLPQRAILLLSSEHCNRVGDFRAAIHRLMIAGCQLPVVLKFTDKNTLASTMQLQVAADAGVLFMDGLADGLFIENEQIAQNICVETAFSILQAVRQRVSKTEYISCPSCGRTLFDLQTTIARVKAATNHLKGLKIGIMGCIVNGPGEMADADYGYVGAGRGKVSLYKKQICVEKNIPETEAIDKLIRLIKENGDWVEQ